MNYTDYRTRAQRLSRREVRRARATGAYFVILMLILGAYLLGAVTQAHLLLAYMGI